MRDSNPNPRDLETLSSDSTGTSTRFNVQPMKGAVLKARINISKMEVERERG